MNKFDVFKAWGKILRGGYPSMSIEITRECPLRCPGCYAYEPEHLQEAGLLRALSDFKGEELIENVLNLVRKHRPLHLSIVGGEPLVRFRELDVLLPKLSAMGVAVQLVTSAVREIPKAWNSIKGLYIVVSIDGLQPEPSPNSITKPTAPPLPDFPNKSDSIAVCFTLYYLERGNTDMFCPRCGSLNQDELAYCRDCGENLSVVSQAMKGHLSVALVSKIDAVIEKKNERFRRDAVLTALLGSAFLFNGILGLIASNAFFLLNLFSILAGVFAYLWSVWNYLGFRRSLELKTKRPKTSADLGEQELRAISSSPEVSTTKLETLNAERVSIYCPKCGMKSPQEAVFCPSCGTDLEVAELPTGMERYMPRSLLTRLDASVAKNEEAPFKPQYRSWSGIMAVAVLFLFSAAGNLIEHHWGNALTNFALGLTLVVSGSWNLVAYRRAAAKDNIPLDLLPPSRLDAIGPFLLASWKTVLAFLAVCSGLVWYFGIIQAVPLLIVALLILFGAFQKFWQRQRYQHFLDESSPSTGELAPPDTLEEMPLAHEPLSITEPTTQFLDLQIDKIEQEKAPTTRKLADRRR